MYIMYSDYSLLATCYLSPFAISPLSIPHLSSSKIILVGLFYGPFNVTKAIRVNLGWNYPLEPGGGTSGFTMGSNNCPSPPRPCLISKQLSSEGLVPSANPPLSMPDYG